jgi:hypothetical protein
VNVTRRVFALAALAAAALVTPEARAAASLTPAFSTLPAYGTPVQFELNGTDWPEYLPATRYSVSGNTITIDYEFMADGWTLSRPDFGSMPVNVGELPPGNYRVTARLFDIAKPGASPQVISTNIPVLAPSDYGVYTVPTQPEAFHLTSVVVRSAVYFDPATMRSEVSNGVVKVYFDYYATAPISSPAPAGSSSYAAVKVGALVPGSYRVEGWGRPKTGGDYERYFTRDVSVSGLTSIVEYYAPSTDHYFITAGADDINLLDSNDLGWKRTGQTFKVWLRREDAPASAVPICRFYAAGPNSHFYGGPSDCEYLKGLEAQQRAEAAAAGKPFPGWAYEQVAFYAIVPTNGQCPGGTDPVYRAYNGRAAQNDSNHRFMVDSRVKYAMVGWADEGAAFCSPR